MAAETMEQEQRHVYYDRELDIEAYQLSGIVQKFPNHFHEYYVIGFIEGGKRHLWCKNREYDLSAGDLILFNPRDNHFCAPLDGTVLDYRAVNVKADVMNRAVREITGKEQAFSFVQNVLFKSDISRSVADLYNAIVGMEPRLKKEEAFYFLLEQLFHECAVWSDQVLAPEPSKAIQNLCTYMEQHFSENLTLDQLADKGGFGKSYLVRLFTRQVGVSPYRYLQTVRLNRARDFLEEGIAPVDAADMAGFADQSHFTNYFKEFTGLTPRQYQRIFTDREQGPENGRGVLTEGEKENDSRKQK